VTLDDGERVVVQRYRRRADAERRLGVMHALAGPAAAAGIAMPPVREADLAAEPPWVVFDLLPGVPVPAAGDASPGGPGFPAMARAMGELVAAFRDLPVGGIPLLEGGVWADPPRLAAAARDWAAAISDLDAGERSAAATLAGRVPGLFAGRPAVLAHGDYAPVNVLTDGERITGLLDFEAVRLADPLFDPAWWAWSVRFASPAILEQTWPGFLRAAGIDPAEPGLDERVRALQILRMLEQLGGEAVLEGGVRGAVLGRLREMLA
jgi:aminoglycoside phosphotransferase (APT) family kinase protein